MSCYLTLPLPTPYFLVVFFRHDLLTMAIFGDKILYSALKEKAIWIADKHTGKNVVRVNLNPASVPPRELRVVHLHAQPGTENRAQASGESLATWGVFTSYVPAQARLASMVCRRVTIYSTSISS